MAESHITCDKDILLLFVKEKDGNKTLTLSYNQINGIRFEKCTERKFISKVSSEKIEISVKNRLTPIVYTKLKEKAFFDEYKRELSKFVKNNHVNFVNNLEP